VTNPPHNFQDIVILTVKSFDTSSAAKEAMPMVGKETVVVSIQNGLGNIETLTEIIGNEKIIGGMAIFGACTEPFICNISGIIRGNIRQSLYKSETSSHNRPQIIHASGYFAR
jgi:ketopantoate reductase